MPRVVSFIVLLAILLLVSAVFFQVMAHFVVPLFLASVLVVVFKPLHSRVVYQIPGYPRVSALVTTLLIMLVVLLPTAWLGWKAAIELRDVYASLNPPETAGSKDANGTEGAADGIAVEPAPPVAVDMMDADVVVTPEPERVSPEVDKLLQNIADRAPELIKNAYHAATNRPFDKFALREPYLRARGLLGSIAVTGAQTALKLLFGLAIMVLALYYFLADGPKMLANLMKMSPLDDEYERELLDKFASVSRAVVVASLASAVAQGLLAGIGFYFSLNPGAPIFLLTMASMVLAIVPFAGAAAIWIPTAAYIYLYQPVEVNGEILQGDSFTAICLAIYGTCVVSAIDNVIKPLVLHGQSNLHPLVALISILGGVQTLGPIGILVGPMLVAFIQALVNMVNKELHRLGDSSLQEKHGARTAVMPLGETTELEAEAAVKGRGSLVDKLLAAHPAASEPAEPKVPPPQASGPHPTPKRRRKRR